MLRKIVVVVVFIGVLSGISGKINTSWRGLPSMPKGSSLSFNALAFARLPAKSQVLESRFNWPATPRFESIYRHGSTAASIPLLRVDVFVKDEADFSSSTIPALPEPARDEIVSKSSESRQSLNIFGIPGASKRAI